MRDSYVKEFFSNIVPLRQDTFGRQFPGRVIGWKRTPYGALGAIVVFPHLSGKYLYGIDPHNGLRTRFMRKL